MKVLSFPIIAAMTLICLSSCNQKASTSSSDTKASESVQKQNAPYLVQMDIGRFYEAALNGDISTVKEAVNSGISVDTLDEENRTVLMLASYNGHTSVVNFLLEQGATIDLVDNTNRTALMFASTGPFNETVLSLLQAGADPNITDNVENFTALMFAAAEGQMEVVATLLENGADKSLKDIDGDGALEFAQANGHSAIVELLK